MGQDWNQIVEDLGPRLYNYFFRRGLGSWASDLTQESLLRLYERVEDGSFDQTRGNLSQFAFGIARLVALESRKIPILEEFQDSSASLEQPADEQMDSEYKKRRVRKALHCLSPLQREVMELILDSDLKIEEVAEILQLPTGTVKSHIFRAKAQLKDELQNIWESL